MAQRGEQAGLAAEAPDGPLALLRGGVGACQKFFERHRGIEHDMKGFINPAHAAMSQAGNDLVTVIEEFSGVKVKIIKEVY
jgi:hypothetical protein